MYRLTFFERIPGHQGNAFAVNTNFFMQLGGFDPGMKVWGAIQMELMLKVNGFNLLIILYESLRFLVGKCILLLTFYGFQVCSHL